MQPPESNRPYVYTLRGTPVLLHLRDTLYLPWRFWLVKFPCCETNAATHQLDHGTIQESSQQ